jgi:hypothetical protein
MDENWERLKKHEVRVGVLIKQLKQLKIEKTRIEHKIFKIEKELGQG